MELSRFIRSVYTMPPDELDAGLQLFKETSVKKGSYLVRTGEICQSAFYIGSGVLRSFYENNKGEEVTYCFCSAHQFSTSFKSFIHQSPSTLSIQALEDCELSLISHQDLQGLYQQYASWQALGRVLVEREFLNMETYATSLNNETAREKYLRLWKEQPLVIKKASVQHIASYLGITRETLSRIRKQLSREIM